MAAGFRDAGALRQNLLALISENKHIIAKKSDIVDKKLFSGQFLFVFLRARALQACDRFFAKFATARSLRFDSGFSGQDGGGGGCGARLMAPRSPANIMRIAPRVVENPAKASARNRRAINSQIGLISKLSAITEIASR